MHDDSETGLYNTLRILRYILPNFHGQNSVKKSTKQYNGEIVIFELHTIQKCLKCQLSLFFSDINFCDFCHPNWDLLRDTGDGTKLKLVKCE